MEKNNTAQIIRFPVTWNGATPSPEHVSKRIHENKVRATEDMMAFIVPPLLEALMSVGMDLDRHHLESATIILAIRALISKNFDMDDDMLTFITKYRRQIGTIAEQTLFEHHASD